LTADLGVAEWTAVDPTGTTFKTAARWRRPSLEFLTGCLTVLASATCGIAAILRL